MNFVWKYCIKNVVKELKSYGLGEIWSVNYMKQISSNQKCWYHKIVFSLTTPMLSLKLSFMSAKDRVTLNIFTAALLQHHYVRLLSVFYWKCNVFIFGKVKFLWFFCQQGRKQDISYQETQKTAASNDTLWNLGNFLAYIRQVKHPYL